MLRMQTNENVNSRTSEINSVTIANKTSSSCIFRFDILTVVTMATAVQCDVTPSSTIIINFENLRWEVSRKSVLFMRLTHRNLFYTLRKGNIIFRSAFKYDCQYDSMTGKWRKVFPVLNYANPLKMYGSAVSCIFRCNTCRMWIVCFTHTNQWIWGLLGPRAGWDAHTHMCPTAL
jgi:hypothetical protein